MLSAVRRLLLNSPATHCSKKNFYFLCRLSAMSETESSQSFRLREEQGDLFTCPQTDALAHCVSQDFAMGKGIAVLFKRKFGGVTELKQQGKGVGDVATLQRGDQYIYYLITKLKYHQKPTYKSLRSSLDAMKKHCLQNDVRRISMPRIGCGLDRLEWDKVRKELIDVFKDTSVTITVYSI